MKTKKTESHELENKKGLFFQIGLISALIIVFAAFEWKTFDKIDFRLKDAKPLPFGTEEIIFKLPDEKIEPPKPKNTKIEIIDDHLKDSANMFNIEGNPDLALNDIIYVKPEPIQDTYDDINAIILVPEFEPEFPGGLEGLFDYLGKNLKYPTAAKNSDIKGTVYVNFVVEPDGSVSNITILRGIGGGCDEEAIRVVNQMPKWKPARQKGRAVRFQFNLPIKFDLQ